MLLVVGLCLCLPPFEIRSASGVKSEAAEDWLERLERAKGKLYVQLKAACRQIFLVYLMPI
jgi:hypothetical protein